MDRNPPRPEFYNVPFTTETFNEMPYRALGRSGLRASNVGLGTWKFGYPETGDGSRVNQALAMQIFDRAVELGVTFWDTANRYNAASGNSERVIGDWLSYNPDQRRNIVIATKIYGGMDGITPNHCGLSRTNILESVYASLERLDCEYIDLLYFHAFDPLTPPEESMAAIEDLVRQDLIRYFGVSNFTVDQVKIYQELGLMLSVRSRIIVVQNRYDILNGENPDLSGVLSLATQSGFSFVAWSPLARGLLTSRYLDISKIGPGDRLFDEQMIETARTSENVRKLAELVTLADEAGIELSQLALAYMLTLPGMGPVIPAVSDLDQLESNACAGGISLDRDLIEKIEAIVA